MSSGHDVKLFVGTVSRRLSGVPVSVHHVFCVALALVPVGCQHVHYTATVNMVRAHAS